MYSFKIKKIAALSVILTVFGAIFFAHADSENQNAANSTPSILESELSPEMQKQLRAKTELESQIKDRSKQLEDINQQLAVTNKNLEETYRQKNSLQREIKSIDQTIGKLNLDIKADQITAERLRLEIESLNYDLRDIEFSIQDKTEATMQLLREIQKNDSATLLYTVLKNGSLADTVMEKQNINQLRSQLSADIASLEQLHEEYGNKIGEISGKKSEAELRRRNAVDRKLIVQDQKERRSQLLTETKNKESVFQKQADELKKLQQDVADEIESLEAELRLKIDPSLLPQPNAGILGAPLAGTLASLLTQGYGKTEFAKYGYRGKWHNGLDYGVPVGTAIFAAEDGAVAAVGNQDSYCYKGAYGKFVVINHNNNLTTLYAHMSKYIVKTGQTVKKGDLIGYAGKTGYATGPHLHFTVFAQPTFYMGPSRVCGPMPFGGDLNPGRYL